MAKHALIGGGSGFIGKYLSSFLKTQGYQVTVISRMPGVERVSWQDLKAYGLPKGVNAVVNLAGQNVLNPARRWTEGFKQNVWNSRVNTSAILSKVISETNDVDAFVNISGVSHYKPHDKKIYDETDEVEEFDFMSRLCVAWEKAAELLPTSATRLVKLRTGVVVGRNGGMIQSMWIPFQMGVGGPLGDGQQILPWIHVEDLCGIIQHVIEGSNVKGILNGVAPEIVTNGQFSKALASAMKRPCLFHVPKLAVEAMFGKDRSALLLSGAKIVPRRTVAYGYQFKYPTARDACEEVVNKKKLAFAS